MARKYKSSPGLGQAGQWVILCDSEAEADQLLTAQKLGLELCDALDKMQSWDDETRIGRAMMAIRGEFNDPQPNPQTAARSTDTTAEAGRIAEGLFRSSMDRGRSSYVAVAVQDFVAVGEIAESDWDWNELPPWAVVEPPDMPGILVPTELARMVAEHPVTQAASMSPGARKHLLEAIREAGGDTVEIWIDMHQHHIGRLTTHRRLGVGGEYVRLSDFGRRVADFLQGWC